MLLLLLLLYIFNHQYKASKVLVGKVKLSMGCAH